MTPDSSGWPLCVTTPDTWVGGFAVRAAQRPNRHAEIPTSNDNVKMRNWSHGRVGFVEQARPTSSSVMGGLATGRSESILRLYDLETNSPTVSAMEQKTGIS